MEEIMIKIENVEKEYRLGEIGVTTLKEELQRFWAKIRKKEDPTRKIGAKNYNKGDKFKALDGVSFEVKKGEAVGLIGHNGAGKSTLLKLITRVTAPTKGKIYLNGRVASMLEVGTGFHGELTGRENIYMNGAILGMTKKEIDEKIESIIDFSEVREFIDTPVKRYSSGMFVKLTFAVASHLNAEILLMDEVLAVGDVNFQQKCLNKMKEVVNSGKTIIYVSHNMGTIRQLCDKVVVLNKGKVEFEGDVEEGIGVYEKNDKLGKKKEIDVSDVKREFSVKQYAKFMKVKLKETAVEFGKTFSFATDIQSENEIDNALLRFVVYNSKRQPVGTAYSQGFSLNSGLNKIKFNFSLDCLESGEYCVDLILVKYDDLQTRMDILLSVFAFSVYEGENVFYNMKWNQRWGSVKFKDLTVSKEE